MHDNDVKAALRNRVWLSLSPVSLTLTVLYVIFTISHLVLLSPPSRAPMATMAGMTALILMGITIAVRRVSSIESLTYPLAFFVILLLSANSAAHMYVSGEIVQTTNLMLVILGSGFMILSGAWYAITLVVTLGAWALAMSSIPEQPFFVHFCFALLSATIASAVFRFVHVRYLVENYRLRLHSEQQQEALEHRAAHDDLTGLANRRKFLDVLSSEAARTRRSGEKVAVLYIDLDNFKPMNDNHGHDYGDEVLKYFSNTLNKLVRETDLVCRLGGDEFAVLLTGLKETSAVDLVVAKISSSFRQSVLIKGVSTKIRLSIGKAVLPDDAEAPNELLSVADSRMYDCKESARFSDAQAFTI